MRSHWYRKAARKRPRILYLQFTNPGIYPPLERGSRIIADAGWEVTFLGAGVDGADGLDLSPHPRRHVGQLRFRPRGWRQKLSYLYYCLWAAGWSVLWRPNWIYVSDMLACPAALLVFKLTRRPVIYHEHDAPGPAEGVFGRIMSRSRSRLIKSARLVVIPNAERAKRVALDIGIPHHKVHRVWNCPLREECEPAPVRHPGDHLWLLYHGSIVPARLPMTIFDAMAKAGSAVCLRVIGYETAGSRGYVDAMKGRIRELGLEERVQFLGALPHHHHLREWVRRSDIGLAWMPVGEKNINMLHMTGASNKPFDYLAGGCALLVSDRPDWKEFYVEPGYGLACDPRSPADIARALRWFLDHPQERQDMGERGRQRILTDWNYETQFKPVLDIITKQPSLV